ncbi:MAG: TIGR04283 family arsenosugar biosynthesis glycosyltransferase [Planctomycetota bacterium]
MPDEQRHTPTDRQRLSVVVPALNEATNIRAAVDHAWRLEPVEVIVADGGSDDGTPDLACQAGALVVTSAPGRGTQLNAGVQAATGEVFLFQHADTWLEPGAAAQLQAALQDPGVQWGAFRQAIGANGFRFRALEWGNALRARVFHLPYGDQAVFARRCAFEHVGGFPDQPLMEDVDLAKRLRRIGRPVLLAGPVNISARRWNENGVVRQTLKNWAILAAWGLGVSPEVLVRWYRPSSPTSASAVTSQPLGPGAAGPS